MNIDEIRNRVAAIAAMQLDDESAHSAEDDLLWDFVRYVAQAAPQPFAEMAAEVSKSFDLDFARWTA